MNVRWAPERSEVHSGSARVFDDDRGAQMEAEARLGYDATMASDPRCLIAHFLGVALLLGGTSAAAQSCPTTVTGTIGTGRLSTGCGRVWGDDAFRNTDTSLDYTTVVSAYPADLPQGSPTGLLLQSRGEEDDACLGGPDEVLTLLLLQGHSWRVVWQEDLASSASCMEEHLSFRYQVVDPGYPPPVVRSELRRGRAFWNGEPMEWNGTNLERSPAAVLLLRQQRIAEANVALSQGRATRARLLLGGEIPDEMLERFQATCESQYLRAIARVGSEAFVSESTDEDATPEERHQLQLELAIEGLLPNCAPESAALERLRSRLEPQVRRAGRADQRAREAEARRRRRRETRARAAETRRRLRMVMDEPAGPFRFGMTRSQAERACRRIGVWDASSQPNAVICTFSGATAGAGFCGRRRVCSLHAGWRGGASSPASIAMTQAITERYGAAPQLSRRGTARVSTWHLDQTHGVELMYDIPRGVDNPRGVEYTTMSLWSTGRQ